LLGGLHRVLGLVAIELAPDGLVLALPLLVRLVFVELRVLRDVLLLIQQPAHLFVVKVHGFDGLEVVDLADHASLGVGQLLRYLADLEHDVFVPLDVGLVLQLDVLKSEGHLLHAQVDLPQLLLQLQAPLAFEQSHAGGGFVQAGVLQRHQQVLRPPKRTFLMFRISRVRSIAFWMSLSSRSRYWRSDRFFFLSLRFSSKRSLRCSSARYGLNDLWRLSSSAALRLSLIIQI